MFKGFKKLISKTTTFFSKSFSKLKASFITPNFEELYTARMSRLAEFINEYSDLPALPITHTYRLQWNWVAFNLAEHFRETGDIKNAIHFYQKVSDDAPQAKEAYFHLGNLYLYHLKNPYKAKYYFNLGVKKGDLDAVILERLAEEQITKEGLQIRQNYYKKLGFTQRPTIQRLSTTEILTKRLQMQSKEFTMQENPREVHLDKEGKKEDEPPQTRSPFPSNPTFPPNVKAGQVKHLDSYFNACNTPSYPTQVSEFYQKLQILISTAKKELENASPWFSFSKKPWETRKADIAALENALNGIAKTHFNDQQLIILCQHIANQELPFLVNWNWLTNQLKKLLTEVGSGKVQANFLGSMSYETLQSENTQAQFTIRQMQEEKSQTQLTHDQKIKDMIKKSDEERKESEKRYNETALELKKLIGNLEKRISGLETEKKTLTQANLDLGTKAAKYFENSKNFEKYYSTGNFKPQLFKPQDSTGSTKLNSNTNGDAPAFLLCPIGQELMMTPVVAEDGHTYEEKNIKEWFNASNLSPMLGKPIGKTLRPNIALQNCIDDYLKSQQLQSSDSTQIQLLQTQTQ